MAPIRATLAIVVGCSLLLTGCTTSTSEPSGSMTSTASTTTPTTPRTTSPSATTVPPPIATTSTTSTTTPGTIPTTTTTVQAEAGPDYIVANPNGVFRVDNDAATLVLDQADVTWAADDGMGGIVYYLDPGIIEHLPAGATTPTVLATNASPNFVTLIDGTPTLEISQRQQGECDDTDSSHAVLVDIITGKHRIYIACIPVESQGISPRSMGGAFSVSVPGGGWPPDAAVWGQLAFRNIELPEWVASLTDWDVEAYEQWAALELDVPANPWPEPCRWCTLSPRLSPDGATLALAEFVPEPADLGAPDWEEFNALSNADQWQRWEDLRRVAEIRLRTIDLATGNTLYSELWAGPGWVLDFDGRYLLYEFGGAGHHSQFPYNMHLIDTHTSTETPINWGVTDPGHSGHISLALSN